MAFVTEAIYVIVCILLVGFVFKAEASEINSLPAASIHHAQTQQLGSTS